MLVDEATSSGSRIPMQTTELLSWFFCHRQTTTTGLVIHLGHLLELLQQFGLALGVEENLGLSEIA
jgi:hypothetical protein